MTGLFSARFVLAAAFALTISSQAPAAPGDEPSEGKATAAAEASDAPATVSPAPVETPAAAVTAPAAASEPPVTNTTTPPAIAAPAVSAPPPADVAAPAVTTAPPPTTPAVTEIPPPASPAVTEVPPPAAPALTAAPPPAAVAPVSTPTRPAAPPPAERRATATPPSATPSAAEPGKPEPAVASAIAPKLAELIDGKLATYVARKDDRSGVASFYRERGFAPLWVGDNGALPRAKAVATFLGGVAVDGLDPAQYPVPRFAGTSPEELAADELKLTNSVLTFARHARTGRLDYNRVSSAAYFELQFPEASDVLRKLAAAPDAGSVLNGFHPQQPGYKALKAELARQRNRAAGIQDPDAVRIPAGQKLRPGMKDERVPLLRKRFKQPATASTVYDPELVEAVKDFQDRSGVDADGIVGVSTVQRLNNELEVRTNRIDTILANMERWRWMPRDLGPTYVIVNVPDYTLKVMSEGKTGVDDAHRRRQAGQARDPDAEPRR